MKIAVQKLLREASVVDDTVVLTGSDGIMIKLWLINVILHSTTSPNCNIIVILLGHLQLIVASEVRLYIIYS